MAWRDAAVDNGSQLGISHTHSRIHRGITFLAGEDITDLDIATPRVYGITVGPSLRPHINFAVSASLGILLQLYYGSTFTGGTAIPSINRNFASSKVATMAVVHTPTGVTLGTIAATGRIYTSGASNGGSVVAGGNLRTDDEFVLAANGLYILRITASADNALVNVNMGWYEEG